MNAQRDVLIGAELGKKLDPLRPHFGRQQRQAGHIRLLLFMTGSRRTLSSSMC